MFLYEVQCRCSWWGSIPGQFSFKQWLRYPGFLPLVAWPCLKALTESSTWASAFSQTAEAAGVILGARLESGKHHCHPYSLAKRQAVRSQGNSRSSLTRAPRCFSVLLLVLPCSVLTLPSSWPFSWLQDGCQLHPGNRLFTLKGREEKEVSLSQKPWANLSSHLTDVKWLRAAQSWTNQWRVNYYEGYKVIA